MRTYRLHFIRHGLTEANADRRYIGVTDLKLSQEGIERLEFLKAEGIYPAVDLVFSSPLSRAVESAEIIYPHHTPIIVDELREYDFGDFENKSADELDGTKEYTEWIAGQLPSPPNGENSAEFTPRICLGLNKIVRHMMEKGVWDAAVICHGGVMMSLFAATALPRKRLVEWTCDTGLGYTARITPSLYAKSGIIEIVNTIPKLEFEEE